VPGYQNYHRSDERGHEAPGIEDPCAGSADRAKHPAANHRTDDTEQNVPVPRLFTDLLAIKPAMDPNTIQAIRPTTTV